MLDHYIITVVLDDVLPYMIRLYIHGVFYLQALIICIRIFFEFADHLLFAGNILSYIIKA